MTTLKGEYAQPQVVTSSDPFITPTLQDNKPSAHDGSALPNRRRSNRMNRSRRYRSEAPSQSSALLSTSSQKMAIEGPAFQPQILRRISLPAEVEPQAAFSYTRTGRISKALKGKRVHICDVCDKHYTRAEHLRRHQLNHGAQLLQCDEKGCKRKFRREDLLLKHREKHDHDACSDLSASNGRPSSSASSEESLLALSVPHESERFDHGGAYSAPQDLSLTEHIPSSQGVMSKHMSLHLDYHESGSSNVESSQPLSISVSSAWPTTEMQSPATLFASPQSDFEFSNSITNSGASSYLPPLPIADLDPWGSLIPFTTRPPTSTSSCASTWTTHDGTPGLRSQSGTPSLSSVPILTSYDAPDYAIAAQELSELVRQQWPPIASKQERDLQEQAELLNDLASVPGVLLDANRLPLMGYYQQQYLPLFWDNFHPTFAVIHRPSFEVMENPTPLLVASMMAIGATYLNDWMAKSIARRLHETCSRLLDKRPSPTWETPDILDMQTIVLIEAFNQFRSRRMPPRLSTRFESLYNILLEDPEAYSSKYLEVLTELPYIIGDTELEAHRAHWLAADSKRRVLLCLYVLDLQQTNLLKSPCKDRGIPSNDYPLPTSDALWAAASLHDWHMLARKEPPSPTYVYDALSSTSRLPATLKSCFRSTVGFAYLSCNPDLVQEARVMQVFSEADLSRQTVTGFHAAMLAAHTPLRQLLAVSGESWILGEKLPTPDQYIQADIELSLWLNSDEAKQAIWHSIQVLYLASTNVPSGLLHEDWCLYLAALVCWSHGMWHREDGLQEVSFRHDNIEAGMDTFLKKMGTARTWRDVVTIDPNEAQLCLAWVKQRISGEMGALIQDAAGVLKKLLTGERPRLTPTGNS